jgi:hypothetical protein
VDVVQDDKVIEVLTVCLTATLTPNSLGGKIASFG